MLDLQGPASLPSSWHELANRELAKESALRYSYAYDERRLDVLRSLLTDDAVFTMTIAGGGEASCSGGDVIVDWLAGFMAEQSDQRRHVVSNVIVEHIDEARAQVVTYLTIFSSEAETTLTTTGFYRFDLVQLKGRWLISQILDVLDRPF